MPKSPENVFDPPFPYYVRTSSRMTTRSVGTAVKKMNDKLLVFYRDTR